MNHYYSNSEAERLTSDESGQGVETHPNKSLSGVKGFREIRLENILQCSTTKFK